MNRDLFETLTDLYKGYETKLEQRGDDDYFVIVNPHGEGNIKVSDSEEEGIIFYFAYHHAHFDYGANREENIQDLIEYVNNFLNEQQVTFEIYAGGEAIMGGSRYTKDFDGLGSSLDFLKMVAGENKTYFEHMKKHLTGNVSCSICSWTGRFNREIVLTD